MQSKVIYLDEPVVTSSAVPSGARGLSRVNRALTDNQLGAEVSAVGLGAEALPDSLVDLQVLQHHLVDSVLQLLQSAQFTVVEGEARLHGEEHVHLGVGVADNLGESLAERNHDTVVLESVVLGVSHDRNQEVTNLGGEIAINTPLVKSRGASEHVSHHHGATPVLSQHLELLHCEVSVLDGGNVVVLNLLSRKLQHRVPQSSGFLSIGSEEQKVGIHVGESIASLQCLPDRKQHSSNDHGDHYKGEEGGAFAFCHGFNNTFGLQKVGRK